jgi:hypothetical protein
MDKELIAQLITVQDNTDIGLHLKTIRGVPGVSAEPGRLAGVVEGPVDPKKGLLTFVVSQKADAFPNLRDRVLYVPFDEIIGIDVKV